MCVIIYYTIHINSPTRRIGSFYKPIVGKGHFIIEREKRTRKESWFFTNPPKREEQ